MKVINLRSVLPTKFKFGLIGWSFHFDAKTGLDFKVTFTVGSIRVYQSQTTPDGDFNFCIVHQDIPWNKIPYTVIEFSFLGKRICGYVVDTTTALASGEVQHVDLA